MQARYVSAYAVGDVLIPNQDYKKQGLMKSQQYGVRGIDKDTNQLVVETGAGELLKVDPARCNLKTIYQMQEMSIAVGDKLRWTKNDRANNTRNGQSFTVAEIADANVLVVDEAGQSRWFNLLGPQHMDYGWVSTIYSSQGKTADRVLVLMDEKTTNRESFYVAVSRAKHGLKLYAADRDALLKRAQASRVKENASDYIPLFELGENNAKTQKENNIAGERAADGRDGERRIGECSERRLATVSGRDTGNEFADGAVGTGESDFDRALESVADSLGRQVEPVSSAVGAHVEQAEFIECEGEFAAAVAAAYRSVEQLAEADQNRSRLAAAVDSVYGAIRGAVERGGAGTVVQDVAPNAKGKYLAMWRRYRQGLEADNLVRLDALVGRRAVENGHSKREIALMLIAGSEVVREILERQGKRQAILYAKKTAMVAAQRQPVSSQRGRKSRRRSIELGE